MSVWQKKEEWYLCSMYRYRIGINLSFSHLSNPFFHLCILLTFITDCDVCSLACWRCLNWYFQDRNFGTKARIRRMAITIIYVYELIIIRLYIDTDITTTSKATNSHDYRWWYRRHPSIFIHNFRLTINHLLSSS